MTSIIKVNNLQNQCGANTINKCGTAITVGASGDTTTVAGNILKSNALQAADGGNLVNQCGTTITLGATGDNIVLASGATQSGFGRSGSVNWITTPKTATFTAADGEGYFCNTTVSGFTVNLPAGVAGAIISINDYARTFGTNGIVVSPDGTDKISAVNASLSLTVNGQTATFVYVDSTQGWINTIDSDAGLVPTLFFQATGGLISTCGDFKTHIFTGPGSFAVTGVAPAPSGNPNALEYLVVAGAGAGTGSSNGISPSYIGGGGGAGGFRYNYPGTCFTGAAGTFPITVGAGGANPATPGSDSVFSSITSAGGGGGGGQPTGTAGGSGAGGNGSPSVTAPGGAGNTPPVSPPQGNPGGQGAAPYRGGGGGGAGAAGSSMTGGLGSPVDEAFIGGTAPSYGVPGPAPGRYFAGGGGGAGIQSAAAGNGASGGGNGAGSCSPSPSPTPAPSGATNVGSGGGHGSRYSGAIRGGDGGSGIVMIRYKFQ